MFTTYYLLSLVGVSVLMAVIDIDLGHSLEFTLVLAAALGVSSKFVQENSRAPTLQEKRRLSLYCTGIAMLFSMLSMFVFLPVFVGLEEAKMVWLMLVELPFVVWLVILGFSLGVIYLILNMVFGWFARKTLASWKAKGKLA